MLRCCPTAYQIALHFWSYMSIAVHALHCSQIVLHLLRCIKITKLSPRQQTRYNTCDHARAKCAVLIVGYIKCSALGTHSTRCYVKNRAHFRGSPLMPIYDWDLRLETPYVQECQVIVISYQSSRGCSVLGEANFLLLLHRVWRGGHAKEGLQDR